MDKCLFMEHLICSLNSWKYNISDFPPHFEEKTNCSSELRLIYSFIHILNSMHHYREHSVCTAQSLKMQQLWMLDLRGYDLAEGIKYAHSARVPGNVWNLSC